MKELIEEFRLFSLTGHQFHPGQWEDCYYNFCKRRYVLWFAADHSAGVTPVEPTAATVAASDPPKSINRAYKLGHKHGMEAARESMIMERSATPGLTSLLYVGGEPAATPLNMREATGAEADAHMMNPAERCRMPVSVLPLRQCVLKEGHAGIHVDGGEQQD